MIIKRQDAARRVNPSPDPLSSPRRYHGAAATMAAIGVIGWPTVAAVGGPALAVRMLRSRRGSERQPDPAVDKTPETTKPATPRKRTPSKKAAAATG